jgi:hypothetical protein
MTLSIVPRVTTVLALLVLAGCTFRSGDQQVYRRAQESCVAPMR